jgi:hypothetical protein
MQSSSKQQHVLLKIGNTIHLVFSRSIILPRFDWTKQDTEIKLAFCKKLPRHFLVPGLQPSNDLAASKLLARKLPTFLGLFPKTT